MLRINSIKQQTLILLVSLTVGLAVVFSSLAVVTAFIVEDRVLSNLLDEQTALAEEYYHRNGELPALNSNSLQIFISLESVPDWARQRVAREQLYGEIFTPDGTHYHYKKFNLGNNTGYTGVVIAEVSQLLAVTNQPRVFLLFFLVFLLALAASIFMATRFSQKIVEPVLALTNAIKRNEDPANDISLPKLDFELGYLADALKNSFEKLHLLLEREKAFTADVSHELRTPLTVLKNSCTLIGQRGFTDSDFHAIKNAFEQMEHIIDVLLALARAESVGLQPCYVAIILEQAIMRCEPLSREDFQLHLNVPSNIVLNANPRLLQLLFSNLLRNAAEHSSEPQLTISAEAGNLVFENSRNQEPINECTHPGSKGANSQGIGQGLYLVSRIMERFGWQLDVQTVENKFRVIINPT